MSESSTPNLVACVAIIGPDGSPLYLHKFPEHSDSLMEIESLIFESINISENRNKLKNIVPQPPNVVLLATGSSFQVFGSQFKLGYKILVVTVKTNIAEPNMRMYISNLSNEFFSQLMNPFYSPFSQINASSFDERVIKDALLIKASP